MSLQERGLFMKFDLLVNKLIENNTTISLAESITGGLFSKLITDVSGSSRVFKGAIICYSNDSKIKQLNVKKETLDKYTAVSSQVSKEMSIGLVDSFNSDIQVSFTGNAGPMTIENTELGLVWITIGYKSNFETFMYKSSSSSRNLIRMEVCEFVLDKLLNLVD